MANMHFKADLLPNSDLGYSLGSSDKRWKVHGEIQPLQSKTFTNVIGTENNWANATFFFGSVKPTSFTDIWTIKYKVTAIAAGDTRAKTITILELNGFSNTYGSYASWNTVYHTSYRPIFYHVYYRLKEAGFNNGYGHALGLRLYSSWNATTAANARTITIDILEMQNCTFTFFDSMTKYASIPGTGSTNYDGYSEFNCADNGLIETGDWDTTGRDYSHSGYLKNGSQFRLPPYTLFGFDRANNVQGISLYESEYSSSTVNINTARVYNTAGIDWTKGLYYSNSGSNFAKSADLNISPAYFFYAFDFRYTDNCVAASNANTLGLVMRQPVYLRGVVKNDGLFYLAPLNVTYSNTTYKRVWTQDLPTSVETDGTYQYVYWFVGIPYYNNSYPNSGYQVNLHSENKLYWYNNNRFEEYTGTGRGIANVTRSGTTFTITRDDGSTFTFTQQDNNTWNALSTSQAGYVSQAPNDTTKFLRGDASWAQVSSANLSDIRLTWNSSVSTTDYILAHDTAATGTPLFRGMTPSNLKTTMSLNNVENTKLSTWAGSSNITTIGTLSSGTVPWARLSGVPSLTTVTQTNQTGSNDYRILLSGTADDTTRSEGSNKSTNLRFNPSTKLLSVGGSINATGDLTLTGNANLNGETYAESITTGSLLVTGAASAPTPEATSNDTSIATTAFVMNAFTANDAMVFKGVINANANLPATHSQGWTYRIGTAGTYANKVCEVGDIIICVTDGTAANNDHWAVIQNNIDGAVYRGTNAFTDANIIIADSTAGKVKSSGKTITTTAPSSNSADTTIPTSKAVWSAIATLDGNLNNTTPGAGKTLTAFSQTDGKVSATFGDISITKSQISDFPTSMTPSSHTHGNITNDGKVGTTADYAIYTTTNGAVTAGSLATTDPTASGTSTTFIKTISQDSKGKITATKASLPTASTSTAGIIQIGTGSTNAAAGNHTHTTSLAADTGTSSITLAHGSKYKLTAGGTSVIFTMPTDNNTDTKVNVVARGTTKSYILGDTTSPPSSAAAHTAVAETGIYMTTTAGQLNATSYKVAESALIQYNTTTGCLEIIV